MDPVLNDIYKNVVGAAPYVLAAYTLLWVGLFGYVAFVMVRMTGLEKQIAVLEEAMSRR